MAEHLRDPHVVFYGSGVRPISIEFVPGIAGPFLRATRTESGSPSRPQNSRALLFGADLAGNRRISGPVSRSIPSFLDFRHSPYSTRRQLAVRSRPPVSQVAHGTAQTESSLSQDEKVYSLVESSSFFCSLHRLSLFPHQLSLSQLSTDSSVQLNTLVFQTNSTGTLYHHIHSVNAYYQPTLKTL
jgi:hypothetical protein